MPKQTPPVTPSPVAPSSVSLSELETFIAVTECGSFSLAAKHLNVSQPAVTARVQKLETALGIKLLHRTTRSVEMTEAGSRLASRARVALGELRQLLAEFSAANAQARTRVVVAATPMIAATLLPRAILAYGERYPDVTVDVLDLRHAVALQALERGECDIAVLALDDPQPKLRFTPLMREDIVLVTPPGHPLAGREKISLHELSPYPVMVLERYAALQDQVARQYERLGLQFRPAVTAVNLTTLLGMLDAGRGITLLPRSMAQHNASQPRPVIPLADGDVHRQYGIFVPRGAEATVASRSFQDFLRTYFAVE
jgi:DNA-binding transcriptional LysR family regulator